MTRLAASLASLCAAGLCLAVSKPLTPVRSAHSPSPSRGEGQSQLTLEEAIRMAATRNGQVRSAFLELAAARSRVRQAQSSFWPQFIPSATYRSSRTETRDGTRTILRTNAWTTDVDASWLLLDSGQRDLGYRAARRSAEAQEQTALDTLRNTIFNVHAQYFDALRFQELTKVASSQVTRAEEIKKQTDLQAKIGTAPQKDTLQAAADFYNARVSLLEAESRSTNATADLKATIGWDDPTPLPSLQPVAEPAQVLELPDLQALIAEGIKNRPDLIDFRKRNEVQRLRAQIDAVNAGLTWTLDATASRGFSKDLTTDNRALVFFASYPLFDGFFRREQARESRLSYQSSQALLVQSERQARAEIESAYKTLKQDVERVQAAKLAREAAQSNYDAASAAFQRGAEGTTIITVLTAQVSLVTAESNYVEALYDTFIAEARLKLVTGRPLAGETLQTGTP